MQIYIIVLNAAAAILLFAVAARLGKAAWRAPRGPFRAVSTGCAIMCLLLAMSSVHLLLIQAARARLVAFQWLSWLLGPGGLMQELALSQDTLTRISGQPPQFFRAPAGLRNMFLQPVLAKLGLRLASWSARGFDTRIGDAERIKKRLLRDVRPGAILLMHDGHAARTAQGVPVILEALPAVLEAAAAAGLRTVTLGEALA